MRSTAERPPLLRQRTFWLVVGITLAGLILRWLAIYWHRPLC